MREELEALLTADAGNEDFLTSPAYEFAAGMLAGEASEFAAGQTVGRYEILCSLGAGGMGQIYLARDASVKPQHRTQTYLPGIRHRSSPRTSF